MTVERRYSNRHPVDFEVIIRYRDRPFRVAHARDLSPKGMYVQTTNLTLPTGTMVEIEFDRWNWEWRIPGIVLHEDARGVGLMFRTALPELYQYETAAAARPTLPMKSLEAAQLPA